MFNLIATTLETPFIASVTALVAALISYVATPLKAALVLYVALMGVAIGTGRSSVAASTIISQAVRMALVVWLVTGSGVYATWVQNLFMVVLPAELTSAITGHAVNASAFDTIWNQAYTASTAVGKGLSTFDFTSAFGIVAYLCIALVACVTAFGIYLVSHIALGLFIIIGPLVIGLSLFNTTAAIFQKWVGVLIGCIVLQLFVLVLLSVCVTTEVTILQQVSSNIGGNAPANLAILLGGGGGFFGVVVLLTLQLPHLAQSIAGGLHFHVGSMVRTAVATARAPAAIAGGFARVVGQPARIAMRRFGRTPPASPALARPPAP